MTGLLSHMAQMPRAGRAQHTHIGCHTTQPLVFIPPLPSSSYPRRSCCAPTSSALRTPRSVSRRLPCRRSFDDRAASSDCVIAASQAHKRATPARAR